MPFGSPLAPRAAWAALAACLLALQACAQEAPPAARSEAAAPGPEPPSSLQERLRRHVAALAADSMEGRATGTPGARRAQRYIAAELRAAGVAPYGGAYLHAARAPRPGGRLQGGVTNVLGVVRGSLPGDSVVVISAHYDHLGVRSGQIYNGADDNASGVAVVLETARRLAAARPRHTYVFAFFDAEEQGLLGAYAFVDSVRAVRLNLNLDMVGRDDGGALVVSGTSHAPRFREPLERLADGGPLPVVFGHDAAGPDDWTNASDHAAFFEKGIPHLYFGVEDHADYHQPTDDADKIDYPFHTHVAEYVLKVTQWLEAAP